MTGLGSRKRFEEGEWYTDYRRYPFFADRAKKLAESSPESVLVAGCGWGFLVDELLQLGIRAYGIDLSPYCVGRAAELGLRNIVQADVLDENELRALSSATPFDLAVTEDLLPVLTDEEIPAALASLGEVSRARWHIVTCVRPSPNDALALAPDPEDLVCRNPELNWKTESQWKKLVDQDKVFNAETGRVF